MHIYVYKSPSKTDLSYDHPDGCYYKIKKLQYFGYTSKLFRNDIIFKFLVHYIKKISGHWPSQFPSNKIFYDRTYKKEKIIDENKQKINNSTFRHRATYINVECHDITET